MARKVEDLRAHLFDQLDRLKSATSESMKSEIERAKAVSDVAQQIIQSAKVEVDYLRATNAEEELEFLGTRRLGPSLAEPKRNTPSTPGLSTGKQLGAR